MNLINKIFKKEEKLIFLIQSYLGHPNKYKYFINKTKIFTSLKYQKWIYFFFIIFLPIKLSSKILISIIIARYIILNIKKKIKIKRPFIYNKNLKFTGKRKDKSYSFPSMSIVGITILYGNLSNNYNNIFINNLYYFIFLFVSITRIFRGLHYFHDILISWIIGKIIIYTINKFIY